MSYPYVFPSNEDAQKVLKPWNISIAKNLVQLTGRQMPQEGLYQKTFKFSYKAEDAEWDREVRGKELLAPVSIENWILVSTERDAKIADDFKQTLTRVAGPMGMNVKEPTL